MTAVTAGEAVMDTARSRPAPSGATGGPAAVEPGERGATRVADRVIAKIAAHAAREALRGAPAAGLVPVERALPYVRVAGRRESDDGGGRGEARLRIAVELGYPADIGAQCRAVRRKVEERVGALVGMEVSEIAISVERLHSAHSRRAGQERVR